MEELSLHHSKSLRSKYPECVPIILISEEQLKNSKLLLNKYTSISKLMAYIRCKNTLNKFQAYYLFVNNMLICQTELIGNLYSQFSSDNGFLYITVRKENTFG